MASAFKSCDIGKWTRHIESRSFLWYSFRVNWPVDRYNHLTYDIFTPEDGSRGMFGNWDVFQLVFKNTRVFIIFRNSDRDSRIKLKRKRGKLGPWLRLKSIFTFRRKLLNLNINKFNNSFHNFFFIKKIIKIPSFALYLQFLHFYQQKCKVVTFPCWNWISFRLFFPQPISCGF